MPLSNNEITGVIITIAAGILKPWATKVYTAWVNDSPRVEAFLIYITFNQYRKKARAAAKAAIVLSLKEDNNRKINRVIDSHLQTLGDRHNMNRVTVARYKWTGKGKFPDKPEITDFMQLDIYVDNEWTGENIRPIMQEWQGRSGAMFAKALHMAHYSPKGYVSIGPTDDDDLQSAQNLFGVDKSWRFVLNKGIMDGTLALSLFHDFYDGQELSDAAIHDIQRMAKKIYYEKIKYIY